MRRAIIEAAETNQVLDRELAVLKEALVQVREEETDLLGRHAAITEQLDALSAELASQRERAGELRAERERFRELCATLTGEIAAADRALDALRRRRDGLIRELGASNDEVRRAREELGALDEVLLRMDYKIRQRDG